MTRGRLGLLLFGVFTLLVLAIGLTRPTNEPIDDADAPTTTAVARVDLDTNGDRAILQPLGERIEVPPGTDCKATVVADQSPSCEGYEVAGVEVAWVVEQAGTAPPVASFIRRESPEVWVRQLRADGGDVEPFDRVNVRIDDVDGDGKVEAIFGFHRGDELSVDVVGADGRVVLHLGLGRGQVVVGGGQLVTFVRQGDRWRREEIRYVDGVPKVTSDEVVDGPANGNL